MTSIAPDVVSYEHEAPLAYVGADEVREVCRRGLEASTGTVTLDIPDLMFRRVRGEWVMSHQQVSFPYDAATGKAATDLRP